MAPDRLIQLLAGGRVLKVLSPEFPSVRTRRPDLVVWLEDGRMIHVELQTTPEPDLDWRMLEYYVAFPRDYRVKPMQILLYVGREQMRTIGLIDEAALRFRYQVIDIRDFQA